MGPKKGGGAAGDDEDLSTIQFMKLYKKNCQQLEILPIKRFNEMWQEYEENGAHFTKVSKRGTVWYFNKFQDN